MYQELREGIITYFKAQAGHAFLTGTGGRLAYYRSPSSWTNNYSIFSMFDFSAIDTFDAGIEDGTVGFNCYSSTAEGADDLVAACVSMFNRKSVTVNSKPVMLRRGMVNPAIPVGDDEHDLWLAAVEFNVRLQR